MSARIDRLIGVRLLIFVVILSASLFAAAAPASGQVKLTFDKHPAIDFGDAFTASFRVKSQNDWRDFPSEPGTDQKNVSIRTVSGWRSKERSWAAFSTTLSANSTRRRAPGRTSISTRV